MKNRYKKILYTSLAVSSLLVNVKNVNALDVFVPQPLVSSIGKIGEDIIITNNHDGTLTIEGLPAVDYYNKTYYVFGTASMKNSYSSRINNSNSGLNRTSFAAYNYPKQIFAEALIDDKTSGTIDLTNIGNSTYYLWGGYLGIMLVMERSSTTYPLLGATEGDYELPIKITFDPNGGNFSSSSVNNIEWLNKGESFSVETPTNTTGEYFGGWKCNENGNTYDSVDEELWEIGVRTDSDYHTDLSVTLSAVWTDQAPATEEDPKDQDQGEDKDVPGEDSSSDLQDETTPEVPNTSNTSNEVTPDVPYTFDSIAIYPVVATMALLGAAATLKLLKKS